MNSFFESSTTVGVVISLLFYALGIVIRKKLKNPIFNPLLLSIIFVILFMIVAKVDYEVYNMSAKYLSYLLAPATVALAIPLYEQLQILKGNFKAVMISFVVGVITSLITVLSLAILFKFNKQVYATLLPKSVTTAIGMSIAEELGGVGSLASAVIIVTGIFGFISGEAIFKIFKIEYPVSKGLALGASSHAMGTAKAAEIGDIECAMSSLAIVICGVLTILGANLFIMLI